MSLATPVMSETCKDRIAMQHSMCESALNESDKRCKTDMETLANECDKALKQLLRLATEQDQYIGQQKQFLEIQETELQRRAKVLQELRKKNDAWYRNPWTMVLLGIAAGAVGTATVGR